jgi:hypothetical protein
METLTNLSVMNNKKNYPKEAFGHAYLIGK